VYDKSEQSKTIKTTGGIVFHVMGGWNCSQVCQLGELCRTPRLI